MFGRVTFSPWRRWQTASESIRFSTTRSSPSSTSTWRLWRQTVLLWSMFAVSSLLYISLWPPHVKQTLFDFQLSYSSSGVTLVSNVVYRALELSRLPRLYLNKRRTSSLATWLKTTVDFSVCPSCYLTLMYINTHYPFWMRFEVNHFERFRTAENISKSPEEVLTNVV